MKYLTKEWLNTELLSYTYSQIKISKKTEKYDEGYYQKHLQAVYRRRAWRGIVSGSARRIKKNRGIDR